MLTPSSNGPAAHVYQFSDPREFLALELKRKRERNRGFSIRAWAKQIGLRAPSLLSAILRGERALTPAIASQISPTLGLSEEEARFFELIVLVGSAKSEAEKETYLGLMKSLRPETTFLDLSVERFRLISDWYHLAILEMIDLKDFRPDAQYLSQRLGHKVSAFLVERALERLERLEMIERLPDGTIRKGAAGGNRRTGDAIPSQAIRNHHLQMIEKAKVAIAEQGMSRRDIRGTTLAIRREDYAAAVEIVRECHVRLQKLAAAPADEVYRLNTQFFGLTVPDGVKP